jgi:predicted dehydrogenase
MNRGNISRRGFLAKSAAGLTALGLPLWVSREIIDAQEKTPNIPRRGPNDRITIAAIGTGTNRTRRGNGQPLRGERGVAIMHDAMRDQNVRVMAVCDVDRPNADFAQNVVNTRYNNRDCQVFTDYRRVLENRDIDAVLIGTPDHWHAHIAIAAMRAGKDVYCEKPLTLTVEEGKAMVRAARATGRIVQTGSQQRSDARFRTACELVRNNRIGRVQRITTLIGDNPQGGPFRVTPAPEGLDWDFWLGPTPRLDYVAQRCHYEFRWWYDYSGGKMTDWGAHHNDIAQWGLGMDDSGPTRIVGRGDQPTSREANSYNCHPNFEVTYTYNNGPEGRAGTQLICRARPPRDWAVRNAQGNAIDNGVLFEGEDNRWIFVNRGTIMASDRRLLDEPLGRDATRLPVSSDHMGNFLSCVRSREQPICHVGVGHRSVTVCHLGTIAIRTGRELTWNPREERFTGDNADAGNTMLSRERRDPWQRLEG